MYRFLTAIIFTISQLQAASIVVIQGDHSPFGRKYFAGFSSLVREKILAYQYDGTKERALIQTIRQNHPDIVITIGDVPIERLAMSLPSTPFIVGDYYSDRLKNLPNTILLESRQPVEIAFQLGIQLVGGKKRFGTIYDPKYSLEAFQSLAKVANREKVRVSAIKVDQKSEVSSYMNAFKGKIDVFFIIRDATTNSETATNAIYAFTQENNIPVISLDPTHMSRGTLLTVSIDPIELGEQAWNVSKIILKERKIPILPQNIYGRELTLSLSVKKAEQFGVTPDRFHFFVKNTVSRGYGLRVVE